MAASMRLTRRSRLRRKPREPTISSAHCPKDTTPYSTREPLAYRRGNGTLAMHHGTLFPEHRRDRIRGFATPDCKAPYSTVFCYGFRPLFRPRSPRGPARPTGCGMRPADPHAGRCGRRNSHAGPESGRRADAWNAGRRSTRATKRTPGSAGR